MALVLNEEQRLLQDTARDFLGSNAPVTALRKLRDERDPLGYAPDLWQQMSELGWASIIIPEQYGGLEFGFHFDYISLDRGQFSWGRVVSNGYTLSFEFLFHEIEGCAADAGRHRRNHRTARRRRRQRAANQRRDGRVLHHQHHQHTKFLFLTFFQIVEIALKLQAIVLIFPFQA